MRLLALVLFMGISSQLRSQKIGRLDTIGQRHRLENIYVKALHGDSLCSAFCLVIKGEVKAHRHLLHSEQVYVLEGEGLMRLANEAFLISTGDLIFIPRNTVHAVKSTGQVPLKVLSIQSPEFDGKDRELESLDSK